jgi:hypothetical protein
MGARKPKLGDKVTVYWEDAWFDEDTSTPVQWASKTAVETSGTLVREGEVISVAGEVCPEDHSYRAVSHIPTEMITRIEVL